MGRGARGGSRVKNTSKPPRFSKNSATQSQDNPSFTQGGTISQPYPISQSGLMSQHAYGLSQQDFSQPVTKNSFFFSFGNSSFYFLIRICMMFINHLKMNIINYYHKIRVMLIQQHLLILKHRVIQV
jgi:hypothetical protein